jgi:hypothetical protein
MSSTTAESRAPGEVFGRRERGSNGLALRVVAGDQLGDPALRHPVGGGDLGLASALDDDSGNHEPGFRHDRASNPRQVSYDVRHQFPMS